MCLTIPGKVIEIKDNSFVVDYVSEKREIIASAIDVKEGDYVLVSNKVIIKKLTEENAKKMLEMLGLLFTQTPHPSQDSKRNPDHAQEPNKAHTSGRVLDMLQ
jgi:hydrogenase assembly chaperone HypC/HupF